MTMMSRRRDLVGYEKLERDLTTAVMVVSGDYFVAEEAVATAFAVEATKTSSAAAVSFEAAAALADASQTASYDSRL